MDNSAIVVVVLKTDNCFAVSQKQYFMINVWKLSRILFVLNLERVL